MSNPTIPTPGRPIERSNLARGGKALRDWVDAAEGMARLYRGSVDGALWAAEADRRRALANRRGS